MSRTIKLMTALIALGISVVAYEVLITPPPPTEEVRMPRQAAVGMHVASVGLAPIGSVSEVITDDTGRVTKIRIQGNFWAQGVREITSDQFTVPSGYVVVKMKRHQFRALPRIR